MRKEKEKMKETNFAEVPTETENLQKPQIIKRRNMKNKDSILLQARVSKTLGEFVHKITIDNQAGPFYVNEFIKDFIILLIQLHENNPKKLQEFIGKNLYMKYFSEITLKENKIKIREDIHDGNN